MGRYVNIDKVLQGKFPVTPHRGDFKDMFNIYMFGWNDAIDVIATMTVEDVVPVVHAHWIGETDDLFPADSMVICSNCGEYEYLTASNDYCGNCGAKMDGEGEG